MTTNRKRPLKGEFALIQTSLILFNLSNAREIPGLNPKRRYLNLQKRKENVCVAFTDSIRRAREIRRFQVAVVQRRLRNVQKKGRMQVQTCCLTNLNLLLFCHSRCCRHCRCLNSLLLSSKNFATMVTLRHTSPLSSH